MRLALAACAWLALASADPTPLDAVRARLARGDASGAQALLVAIAEPAPDRATDRAAWLDASARVAWGRGDMDRAFALSLEALATAERAGVELPPLTPALGPGRAWLDAEFALPLRTLPTGDSGAKARDLAARLLALPEAKRPDGAWLVWAARLLDPSVAAPAAAPKSSRESAAQALSRRRAGLMQAAFEARAGEAKSGAAVLRAAERPDRGSEGFARWFEAEALAREGARRDARLASLRFVQAAAAFDDAPWLRVAALRRAADMLEPIDPREAERLRTAARQETP